MRVKLKDDTVFKDDEDGNLVIINISDETDKYYKLSGVSMEVFRLMSEDLELDAIKSKILQEYNVDEKQLSTDIEKLISSLEEHDLVEVDE